MPLKLLTCVALVIGGMARLWLAPSLTNKDAPSPVRSFGASHEHSREGSVGAASARPNTPASSERLPRPPTNTDAPVAPASRTPDSPGEKLSSWTQHDLQSGIEFREVIQSWKWRQYPLRGVADFAEEEREIARVREGEPHTWKWMKKEIEKQKASFRAQGRMLSALRSEDSPPPLATTRFQFLSVAQPLLGGGRLDLPGRDLPVPASPQVSLDQLLAEHGIAPLHLSLDNRGKILRSLSELELALIRAKAVVAKRLLAAAKADTSQPWDGNVAVRDGILLGFRVDDSTDYQVLLEDAKRLRDAYDKDIQDIFR